MTPIGFTPLNSGYMPKSPAPSEGPGQVRTIKGSSSALLQKAQTAADDVSRSQLALQRAVDAAPWKDITMEDLLAVVPKPSGSNLLASGV